MLYASNVNFFLQEMRRIDEKTGQKKGKRRGGGGDDDTEESSGIRKRIKNGKFKK